MTVSLVILALAAGLWLDNVFQTRPILTVLLMVGSVPLDLFLSFLVVRRTTKSLTGISADKREPEP